jgi:hypothetical protein
MQAGIVTGIDLTQTSSGCGAGRSLGFTGGVREMRTICLLSN